MMADDEVQTKAVGPYMLQKTLGKGQTGELPVVRVCADLMLATGRPGAAGRTLRNAEDGRH